MVRTGARRKKQKAMYATSRRARLALLAIFLLLAALVVTLDRVYVSQRTTEALDHANSPASDMQRYNGRTFKVINVVDGDTLDVDFPDDGKEYTRVRLWGVDTPETHNPRTGPMYFGREASDFAKSLALGKEVTLYLDPNRTRGYYGRLLAYVQLPDRRYLNEVLLSEGFAYADLRFKHEFYQKYKQLESAARSQKKGLWRNVTQEQLPQWLRKRKPTLLKNK